jgi:hypothetical protein
VPEVNDEQASPDSSKPQLMGAVTVQWYLKSEQPFVQAIWQCMLGVSSIITSILGVRDS